MAWALAALVVISGIVIFIEALVLLIAKEKSDINECRKF